MYNSIQGTITFKGSQTAGIQTGGVEWLVEISTFSLRELPVEGEEARVLLFLYHREDQLKLFGFASESERKLFLDLIGVSGIGPKQAIKILSGASVESIIKILELGDVDSLTGIPGLGKKTAQKIILALKGKLQLTDEDSGTSHGDILTALSDMGFDRRKAQQTIKRIEKQLIAEGCGADTLETELFKRSIVELSS
jgi:holliday junction DNA helicase RuvA